jgi:lysophospholipase L1-like esterase
MYKFAKFAVSALGILSLCVPASAANPPHVFFIGDYITANWTFPTGATWANAGYPTPDTFQSYGSSTYWAQNFSEVLNAHPDIVHIMVGAEDAATASDGTKVVMGTIFAANIEGMVQQAKAANIKVILATTPAGGPDSVGITQFNAFITAYGAANGIPVVNYADALCTCVNGTSGLGLGNAQSGTNSGYAFPVSPQGTTLNYHLEPLIAPDAAIAPAGFPALPLPTTAGYALMTQMVQNAIATTTGAKLKSGYLQDISFGEGLTPNSDPPLFNQNKVNAGNTLQFTPYGGYSDGATRPIYNSNYNTGASGTWTSSNPVVMSVTQTGIAYALSPGTAWISYTSPEGVIFSPWVMTVAEPFQ